MVVLTNVLQYILASLSISFAQGAIRWLLREIQGILGIQELRHRNISRQFDFLSRSVHLMFLAQFSPVEVPLLLSSSYIHEPLLEAWLRGRIVTITKLPYNLCARISMRWTEIEGSFG
ncbi:hypothetical protein BDZ97DRAFT_1876060, partial [Flammula alnicola]